MRALLGEAVRQRPALVIGLGLGLFVIAIRAPLMDLPLERDEGEYAYIGWRLAHGELPYRDWFDQKPPGVFVAYAAALALPGDPVLAIRAVAALFAAVSCVLLFFLVRHELGTASALLAAVLLGVLSADPMIQGPTANTEIFMLPGIVAATALFLRVIRSPGPAIIASVGVGALLGVATAFKQVAAVNALLFLLLLPASAGPGSRWSRSVRLAGWMFVGGLLVWTPILMGFTVSGAFGAALDAILWHNLDYTQSAPASIRLANLTTNARPFLLSQGPAWALALVGVAVLVRRGERFLAVFFVGWILANAVGVSASGHYFPHYFQQMLPCIAVLASAALGRRPLGKSFSWSARAVLLGALALVPAIAVAAPLWRASSAEATRRIYPTNAFELMPKIAAEVAAITGPDDRVFVFGAEPQLLFYARRVSASRYIHLFPLYGPYADAAERQREVVSELEATEPAVIVWAPNSMFFGSDRPQELTVWLRRLLRERYRAHAVVVRQGGSRGRLLHLPEDRESRQEMLALPISKAIYVRYPR